VILRSRRDTPYLPYIDAHGHPSDEVSSPARDQTL
jgi:hypothetical protein